MQLFGTKPNQVPTNADLGGMAYQDPSNVNLLAMPRLNGDYLIEEGSNANGSYVRFASGLQICRFIVATPITTNIVAGASYISAAQSYTFPAAFTGSLADLQVAFSAFASSGALCWVTGTWSLTGVSQVYAVSTTSASTCRPSYIAIGKWK